MAENGWTARLATAAGAAAGTGAAQLGLGYGLGVVVWPVAATPDDGVWLGSLGWATWITASATVFGAVLAARIGDGRAVRFHGKWRLAIATSAAVGALMAVALIALPARTAERAAGTFSPPAIAAGYALLGVVLGLVVAYWAVVCRPIATNLLATGVWLWALAIAAVVVDLTLHRPSATYLTSWQFAELAHGGRFGAIFWPSAVLTLASAFLIGILSAAPAVRRGHLTLGMATSGTVGPLLVAIAFLALAPQLTGALGPLESAYLIAPYAVLAGLAGSALSVAGGRAAIARRAHRTTDTPKLDTETSHHQREGRPGAVATGHIVPAGRTAIPGQADPATRAGETGPTRQAGRVGRGSSAGETDGMADVSPSSLSFSDKGDTRDARPARERAKKVAPARKAAPSPSRSTVTPPPADPTIAQINPKPTAES